MIAEQRIKELEGSQAELTVTVSKETLAAEYAKTLAKYSKTLQIKGFRKGKVPASILEKKYGEAFKEETLYSVIESSVEEAMKSVDPAQDPLSYSTPKLNDEADLVFDAEKDLTFSVTYDVFPTFELPTYTGITATIPKVSIPDSQVDEEIQKLRDQNAMVIEKEGAVTQGDIVTIDYAEVDDEGTIVEGTAREDFVFTIGTGYNFYKLDDDLIGLSKDETKTITKSYADDFEYPELAGTTKQLLVTLKTIKTREMPELDDEFAQDISDAYETFADLVMDTRTKLEKALEGRLRENKFDAVVTSILENVTVTLPVSMIQAELENSWRNFASQSGMPEAQLMQILEIQGKTRDQILEEWRPQSEKSLKVQMLLEKIVDAEKIEITEEELEAESKQLEGIENPQQRAYYRQMLKEDMKTRRAGEVLIAGNTFIEGDEIPYAEYVKQRNY